MTRRYLGDRPSTLRPTPGDVSTDRPSVLPTPDPTPRPRAPSAIGGPTHRGGSVTLRDLDRGSPAPRISDGSKAINRNLTDRYGPKLDADLDRVRPRTGDGGSRGDDRTPRIGDVRRDGDTKSDGDSKLDGPRIVTPRNGDTRRDDGAPRPRLQPDGSDRGGKGKADDGNPRIVDPKRDDTGTRRPDVRRPSLGDGRYRTPDTTAPRVDLKPRTPRTDSTRPILRTTPRKTTGSDVTPRLRPHPRADSRHTHTRGYSSYSIAGSHRHFYGSYHWTSHLSALLWCSPYYSSWGYYSYPYWFSGRWCDYYNRCGTSFTLYWNSCYPRYTTIWWWPRRCYVPGSYFGFTYFDNYCDDYVDWYATPRVVYREVVRPEVVTVGGASAATAPAEDPAEAIAKLAEKHVGLGDWYFREGRWAEAVESYLRALTYAPEDAALHFVIADALFAQGDYHYAAYMIGRGLALDPALAAADTDKRTFYGDPARFDEQVAILRRYVDEKPYDAAAHIVLGYNLRFSGDAAGAKATFERVLVIEPSNEPAKVFLAALAARESRESEPREPAADGSASRDAGASREVR